MASGGFARRGSGSGSGVRHVRELPTPEKGVGNLYYVVDTYLGPGPWAAADFDLTLTPGDISGRDTAVGYTRSRTMIEGGIYEQAGAIDPLPDGLEVLGHEGSLLFAKLSGQALARAAGRDLTVSFGGNDYTLNPLPGYPDEWSGLSPAGHVAAGDRWTAGTPVTVRVFLAGTETGLLGNGFAAIGEKGKLVPGPYRARDFDFVLTPGDNGVNRYGSVDGIQGFADFSPPGLEQIYQAADTRIYIWFDNTRDGAFGNLVQVSADGNSRPATRGGGQAFYSTSAVNPVPRWAPGTPVTLRFMTSATGDRGLTPEGIKDVGELGNPRNLVGTETVNRGFWHVDPATMEWREGFGGDAGGIPAAILPEAGLTAAQKENEQWRGILVGVARENAGIDWTLVTAAGQEAVQATAAIEVVSAGSVTSRLVVTIDSGTAAGEAGNDWFLSVRAGAATAATADAGTRSIILTIAAGTTFAAAAAVLRANPRVASTGVAGDGTAAIPNSLVGDHAFTGGLDADELGVEIDDAAKTITLEHLTGHTQAEIVEFLNDREVDAETTLYAVLGWRQHARHGPRGGAAGFPALADLLRRLVAAAELVTSRRD